MTNLGTNDHQIYHGNCFEIIPKLIEQGIKVDAVICDMPFGVTTNSWDKKLNLQKIWALLKQIKKDKLTPIVLFADKKEFETELYLSNKSWYRYEWIWNKQIPTGFLNSAYSPLMVVEKILVFSEIMYLQVPSQETWKKYDRIAQFYPQFTKGQPNHSMGKAIDIVNNTYDNFKPLNLVKTSNTHSTTFYRPGLLRVEKQSDDKLPTNLLTFAKLKPNKYSNYHPTQKPSSLLEYLVKTYTLEGQTVLDFCAGSGSLLHACKNTKRKSISIELEEKYIEMIKEKLWSKKI